MKEFLGKLGWAAKSILTSRKNLLGLISWLVVARLFAAGAVEVDVFVDATVVLAGILITMHGVEDAAAKRVNGHYTQGGTTE